jgi:hypothetical protein
MVPTSGSPPPQTMSVSNEQREKPKEKRTGQLGISFCASQFGLPVNTLWSACSERQKPSPFRPNQLLWKQSLSSLIEDETLWFSFFL